MLKNWLGRKDLQFTESLTEAEKDSCSTLEGLFIILTNKFKPQFNKTLKSLQFCKLITQNRANTEEWMGRLWLPAIE